MKRIIIAGLVGMLAALAATPAAHAAPTAKDKPEKARVDHLGTMPFPGGIGANFKDGHMFVTGHAGLAVYDIRTAGEPKQVALLPLPHYQNEDVSIGGNRLLLSGDGYLGGGVLIVVDIANPAQPRIERVIKMYTFGGPGHTATCIQDCKYAWVAGYGSVYVLNLDEADQYPGNGVLPGVQNSSAASKVEVGDIGYPNGTGGFAPPHEFGWSTHDVNVDDAGRAWVVGGNGTAAFDVRPEAYPVPGKPYPRNLLEPTLVARTGPDATNDGDAFDPATAPDPENSKDTLNDFIHHSSLRPDAKAFRPRSDAEMADPAVRPGELVLIGEEDIWNRATASATPGGCETQGSLQTWQVKQYGSPDASTSTVENLDSWTTEFNEALGDADNDPYGRDLVPTKGMCSAHYFDERDGIVAVGWYEQGTRLLDVSDPTDIEQVAYFLPSGANTWAAYWSPTAKNVLYVVDNVRGIDVLRFKRGKAAKAKARGRGEVEAPLLKSWLRPRKSRAQAHPNFGFACRLPRGR